MTQLPASPHVVVRSEAEPARPDIFVMLGHTGANLLKVDILTVEQHIAQYPLIVVEIMVLHHHKLTSDQIR